MKVSIKKKYIGITTTLISSFWGFVFLKDQLVQILQENISVLIAPTIFLTSAVYAIYYWLNLRFIEKLADEVSKQVANGDPQKADQIKNHLWNKSHEEAYTVNFLPNKIKFTSSWAEQAEVEENKTVSYQEKTN